MSLDKRREFLQDERSVESEMRGLGYESAGYRYERLHGVDGAAVRRCKYPDILDSDGEADDANCTLAKGPTLTISITPTCCPGDPGCSVSASSKAGSTAQTPSKLALDSSSGSNGKVAAPEKVAESLGAPSSVAEAVGGPSSVAESVGGPSNVASNLGSTPQSPSKIALGSSSGLNGNAAASNSVDDSEPCDEL